MPSLVVRVRAASTPEERISEMTFYKWIRRESRLLIAAAAVLMCVGRANADEVVVGHLSIVPVDSIKAAVPHRIKLSDKKPASISTEPVYRGKPMYGSVILGTSKRASITVVLDTFEGDKIPKLYVDLAGTGDLSAKTSLFALKPLSDFSTDTTRATSVVLASPTGAGVPVGALAATVARYDIKGAVQEVKCPLLFTLIGDELDYTVSTQHVGTLNVSGKQFRIALVDTNANAVFDNFTHGSDQPSMVNLMIDRNDDGKFDPKHEAFDLAKPFRLAGAAYEVASVDPQGTIIALQTTTKRPEGSITPDELAVGTDMIDFVARTIEGKTVSFPSAYKHRVVLLDFWATWCPPCVEEVPNIVAVYNQYHNYGFDILGVSLDKANQLDTVINFCRQAGMTWPQIYDGKYWNAEIAKLYGIDSIPRAFLVDGDTGTILAMGDSLRGDGLGKAVAKALSKKGLVAKR